MTNLLPEYRLGDLVLTSYPFAVEFGGSHGAPETREELVESMLADGDIVDVPGYGNREMSLVVYVDGADLADLAENEVTLRRECSKSRNLLTFDPGDGFGSASVFETFTASMVFVKNESGEMAGMRRWELTIPAAPFARSADLTTVEALAPPPATETTITVNDADSTAGWGASLNTGSGSTSITIVDEGTAVSASGTGFSLNFALDLTATPVDMSLTPYLLMEMSGTVPAYFYYVTDGASAISVLYPVLARASSAGTTLYALDVGAVTDVVSVGVVSISSPQSSAYRTLTVHDVSRSDTLPQVTARQITRIIETGGTERTPGSIHVEAANGTDLLSTTIVHTSPEDGSGYSPPLRRWRDSGNTITADAGTFSGEREPIHPDPFVSKVSTSAMPEGGYLLAAFLRCTTAEAVQIYWNLGTIPPGGTRSGDLTDSIMWTFVANVWMLVPLGAVSLPTLRGNSGTIQVDILRDAASAAQVEIDDAWLFREGDDCALSVVNVSYPNLWLDSADLDNPVPTVWVGADAQARTHPGTGLVAMGTHVLNPDGTALFTASSNSDYPTAEATFYRRWHSNAAE